MDLYVGVAPLCASHQSEAAEPLRFVVEVSPTLRCASLCTTFYVESGRHPSMSTAKILFERAMGGGGGVQGMSQTPENEKRKKNLV